MIKENKDKNGYKSRVFFQNTWQRFNPAEIIKPPFPKKLLKKPQNFCASKILLWKVGAKNRGVRGWPRSQVSSTPNTTNTTKLTEPQTMCDHLYHGDWRQTSARSLNQISIISFIFKGVLGQMVFLNGLIPKPFDLIQFATWSAYSGLTEF